jgi:hypothetical protein
VQLTRNPTARGIGPEPPENARLGQACFFDCVAALAGQGAIVRRGLARGGACVSHTAKLFEVNLSRLSRVAIP